jgi:hypothetical protein
MSHVFFKVIYMIVLIAKQNPFPPLLHFTAACVYELDIEIKSTVIWLGGSI